VSSLRDELHEAAVAGLDPAKPVVMLNLMKFRARSLDGDGSGWDAYLRYSQNTSPLIKARGGTIVWTGDVRALALGPSGAGGWDYAALVFYPSPGAFLDMMTSPEYARGNTHRENGCEKHVILATHEAYSKLARTK
jgi:uncharacterized protein (DUF1330 family)